MSLQRLPVVERLVMSAQVDNYLGLEALASYSGLAERTLRAHIASPVHPLPHYRIGGRVLIRRSDYDQWATAHRRVGVNLEERVESLQGRARRRKRGAAGA